MGRDEFVGVIVVPPDRKEYGALDPGKASATVTLAPNLLSGSFVMRNLEGFPSTARRLDVSGSWKCASVFRRTR